MTIGLEAATANTVTSVVSGLIKLTGRVDNIMAEEAALRKELALVGNVVIFPTPAIVMKRNLRDHLQETKLLDPDPIAPHRAEIRTLVGEENPAEDKLLHWMDTYLPGKVQYRVDDPNGNFQKKLRAKRETWDLDDSDIARVGFMLGPGADLRENKTVWQLATAAVSVITEVAVANQELVLRDDRAKPILVSVLERFASEEFERIGSPRMLFKFVLRATLNSALDARDELGNDKVWVDKLLSALATARDESGAGDDFVVGLVNGRGYSMLIRSLLHEGASHLDDEDASNFEKVVADVLKDAAGKVEGSPSFEQFFKDNWGSLVRAGLTSVHANGAAIFDDRKPILKETLLAAIKVLAEPGNREYLGGEHLTTALEAAIGAVAANPALLDDAAGEDWIRKVLTSVASVIKTNGVRHTLSSAGTQNLVREVFGALANYPELLGDQPEIVQTIAGSILEKLSEASGFRLEDIAHAGIAGALIAVSENPGLLDTKYAHVVADFAGGLANALKSGSISSVQGEQLIGIAASAIAANPDLFTDKQDELARKIFEIVTAKAATDPAGLVQGSTLVELVDGVLQIVATRGTALLGDESVDVLVERIGAVIEVGLKQAAIELGVRLDLSILGTVMVRVVLRWASGEIPVLDVDDAQFQQIFAGIAEDILQAAA
jgi:hypothetical protein